MQGDRPCEELAQLTGGIWQGEGVLIIQQRLRDEWSERWKATFRIQLF